MFKYYIEKYVNNLTINDVYNYARENNITLSSNEAEIIYKTIKNSWSTLLYSDHHTILERIKNDLDYKNYQKIDELIVFYKSKYKNYLT